MSVGTKNRIVAAGIVGSCLAVVFTSVVIARGGSKPVEVAERAQPAQEVSPPMVREVADAGVTEVAEAQVDEVDHATRATELIQEGDADAALLELDLAAKKDPENAEIHWKIARLDEGTRGDEALRDLARLNPTDVEPIQELAKRRLDRDDFAGAVEAAKEAVRRAPTTWETHHALGRAYMGQGKLAQAIAAFRRSGQQAGAPSFPFNNLGYALLLSGKPEDALEALDSAVERGPVTHFMMNNLGLAYEKLGRFDDAEVAFIGALDLKPDYVKAKVNLERIADTKEQMAKAEQGEDDPILLVPPPPEAPAGTEPQTLHGG